MKSRWSLASSLVPILVLFLGAGLPGTAASQALPPPNTPSVGAVIPEFETTAAVDGSPQRIAFPKGSSTVLLFFLSGCPTCHKMIPEWNRAYERRPPGLKVVGVLMDQEPPGFFATMPIAFPVVRSPGREFLKTINVNRAPVTLRIASGGKVEEAALGIIDPIRLGEIFRP